MAPSCSTAGTSPTPHRTRSPPSASPRCRAVPACSAASPSPRTCSWPAGRSGATPTVCGRPRSPCWRCSRCSATGRDVAAADLSGGQQQMLAVAMAFIARPRVLLIDELSLGLAPVVVAQLLPVVQRLAADGVAVVLVEQSVNVALTIADRAYFMERGMIRFSGATADLLARPDLLRSVFLSGAVEPSDRRARRRVSTPAGRPGRPRADPPLRRHPCGRRRDVRRPRARDRRRHRTERGGEDDHVRPRVRVHPGRRRADRARRPRHHHGQPVGACRGRARSQLPGRAAVPGDDGARDAGGGDRALGRQPQRRRCRDAAADGVRRRGAHEATGRGADGAARADVTSARRSSASCRRVLAACSTSPARSPTVRR